MTITRLYETEVRFAIASDLAADDGTTTTSTRMEGYAVLFNSPSVPMTVLVRGQPRKFVERIAPGALNRSVAAAEAGQHNVFALWSHDRSQPLGSTKGGKLSVSVDDTGLRFSLDTSRLTPAQLDAVRDGEVRMSFGFASPTKEHDHWERQDDGSYLRTISDLTLNEISPVITPAYLATSAALRSSEVEDAVRSIEELEPIDVAAEPAAKDKTAHRARLKKFAEVHSRL